MQTFQHRPLPAADRLLFGQALEQYSPPRLSLFFGNALETADRSPCHKAVAMNTHKTVPELLFQMGQRLLDKILPLRRFDGDIFKESLNK